MKEIRLNPMDDMHFHPRDDDAITEMVMDDLWNSGFRRGIPIFNYREPIETAPQVDQEMNRLYRINSRFVFIPSIMLTRKTTPEIIYDVYSTGTKIIKWMSDGLSTNSANGVSWDNIKEKYPCLRTAEELGMNLMIHNEASFHNAEGKPITHPLWREHLAIPKFDTLARDFPGLPISFEHISTEAGVNYVLYKAPPNVKGAIATQHLIGEVRDVYKLDDGKERIIPDQWCMPIFKYRSDREALIKAATGGSGRFFYGGDKAPHRDKNPLNPPAGVYTGRTDICLLAKLFEKRGASNKLNDFLSGFGAAHYGLPRNTGTVILRKEEWIPPEEINGVKIFGGGRKLDWKVV
ncbi:MAG: hypothetical protein WAV31_06155 [Candidatus Moraniibacteriota bacterium]